MTDRELEHVLAHADCDIAVVEDCLVAAPPPVPPPAACPRLRKIVVMDFAGPKPHAGHGRRARPDLLVGRGAEEGPDPDRPGRAPVRAARRERHPRGHRHPGLHLGHHRTAQGSDALPRQHHAQRHQRARQHQPRARAPPGCPCSRSGTPSSGPWSTAASPSAAPSPIRGRRCGRFSTTCAAVSPEYLVIVPSLLEAMEKSIGKRLGFLQGPAHPVREVLPGLLRLHHGPLSRGSAGRNGSWRSSPRFLPSLLLSPVKLASHFVLRRTDAGSSSAAG